jgi:hypothetical protein
MVAVDTSGFLGFLKEFLRAEDGGGDLSRGEIGQDGVLSPDPLVVIGRAARGSFEDDGSEVGAGCNCGAVAAESAR